MPEYNLWDFDRITGRLAGLGGGTTSIIWTARASFVRVRCLRAGTAWEFQPVRGGWRSVTVGRPDQGGNEVWAVQYSDGVHEPRDVGAVNADGLHRALWDAVAFLSWDLLVPGDVVPTAPRAC